MGKKILYIVIIIFLIIVGIFVATKITENDETKPTVANTLEEKNKINETNIVEVNTTVEINGIEIENNIENSDVETENTEVSPEEQAKQIVKENWGEDDTVYYSYDGIKDGKHVVCVREKSTTKELYRYYVDIETGTFDIE